MKELLLEIFGWLGYLERPTVLLQLGLLQGWLPWLLVSGVGLAATLIESLVGAVLQPRLAWLSNELVNALQTLIAALLAMGLAEAGAEAVEVRTVNDFFHSPEKYGHILVDEVQDIAAAKPL